MSHGGTSSNASIKAIDKTSIHRITSGQVVIDLQTAVKELVENSLDAHATSIEVRFRQYGLSGIEVVDDGCGIAEEDYDSIALKHHTSKLTTYDDLTSLQTFGFRGEALSSLCALCQSVSVTTSTKSPMGVCLDLDTSGKVKSRKTVARPRGTTITLKGLFHPLPVRRKELENNIKREFTKALGLLNAYALLPCAVDPGIRLTVSNQPDKGAKSQLLSTLGTPSVHASVTSLWGPKALENIVDLDMEMEVERERGKRRLQVLSATDEEPLKVKVKGLISKFNVSFGRTGTDRQFFYVNGRPCVLPKVQKAFNEVYRSFNATQSPFVVADFVLPKDALDVNVSPDKRTIFLDSEGNLIVALKSALESHFNPARSILDITSTQAKTTQTLLDQRSFSNKRSAPIEPNQTNDALQFNAKSNIPEPLTIAISNIQSSPSDINTSTAISSQTPLFLHDPDEIDEADEDAIIQHVDKVSTQRLTSEKSAGGDEQEEIIVNTSQASWNRAQHLDISENSPQQTSQPMDEEVINEDDNVAIGLSPEGPVRKKRKSEALASPASPLIEKSRTPEGPTRLNMHVTKNLSTMFRKGTGHRTQPTSRDKIRQGQLSMHKYLSGFASNTTHKPVDGDVDDEMSNDDVAEDPDDVEMPDIPTSEPDPDIVTKPVTDPTDNITSMPSKLDVERSCSKSGPPDAPSIKSTGDNAMNDPSESDEDASAFTSTPLQEQLSVESLCKDDIVAVPRPEIIHNDVDGNDVTFNFDFAKVQSTWAKHSLNSSRRNEKASEDYEKVEALEEAGLTNTDDEAKAVEILSRIIDKTDFATMDVIGQFNLGFIIARRRKTDPLSSKEMDDLFIIDQHAADEKYNFETLQQTTSIQSQKLFRPRVLELTASDELVATENIGVLRKNGFEVDVDQAAQSGNRLKLTAQPVSKTTVFDMKDLEELIHLMREIPTGQMIRCSKARSMFAMRACRKSVMVGMPLNRHQMGNVVRHMGMIDQPWNCPHGRPTMRHLVGLDDVKKDDRKVNWKD